MRWADLDGASPARALDGCSAGRPGLDVAFGGVTGGTSRGHRGWVLEVASAPGATAGAAGEFVLADHREREPPFGLGRAAREKSAGAPDCDECCRTAFLSMANVLVGAGSMLLHGVPSRVVTVMQKHQRYFRWKTRPGACCRTSLRCGTEPTRAWNRARGEREVHRPALETRVLPHGDLKHPR
jgi:hypothetical protein